MSWPRIVAIAGQTEGVPSTHQEFRKLSELPFQPGRLRLARELRELSQAQLAKLSGISAAAVSQFESGATRPSEQVLESLSAQLRAPSEFFRRPIVETHEGFFRSLRRTSVADRRRARAFAQVVHDLAEAIPDFFPAVDLPPFPVAELNDLDAAAQAARAVRAAWKLPSGPVGDVVNTLEAHGIVVIRLPFDSADVDAFSLPFDDRPVVVLGSDKDDRARSRFDAAHELGHLVMHGHQVWGVKEVEQQAHAFAAEFLMPADEIRDHLPTRADWAKLFDLKKKWQVSLAALLMRAKTLDRMSQPNYLTAVKAASARGWRRVEPVPLGQPETPKRTTQLLESEAGQQAALWLPDLVVGELAESTSA